MIILFFSQFFFSHDFFLFHLLLSSLLFSSLLSSLLFSSLFSCLVSQAVGKGTVLLWVNIIAHAFSGEATVLPIFPKKAEAPWVRENFQVGASGSPTACHEDSGIVGVFQGS